MKIYIHQKWKKGAWGGGNQFLKALRKQFINLGVYTEKPFEADIILFNSYPFNREIIEFFELIFFKIINKKAIFFHRLDGPMSTHRGSSINQILDKYIAFVNDMVSDANIYQSTWSKKECKFLGIEDKSEITILNAPDPSIFYKEKKSANKKIKIIATSWSNNFKKGFDAYEYLDDNLDFKKFDMTFVGNSPIKFKNIKHIKPLDSENLAYELKKNDFFITASRDDPCSNSLIEGIHCGLIPLARKSGGHPEIVNNNELLFENNKELLNKLNILSQKENIKISDLPNIYSIADKYIKFFKSINELKRKKIINNKFFYKIQKFFHLIYLIKFGLKFDKYLLSHLPRKIQVNARQLFKLNIINQVKRDSYHIDSQEKVIQIIDNIPFFLKTLISKRYPNLYNFSVTGDITNKIPLVNSIFALKIISMLEIRCNRKSLIDHILKFQQPNGFFIEKDFSISQKLNLFYNSFKSFPRRSNLKYLNNLAQTRQAYAALILSGYLPEKCFDYKLLSEDKIHNYITNLNWRYPWSAGSHFSHHIFFLNLQKILNKKEEYEKYIDYSFDLLQNNYQLKSGFWGIDNQISDVEKINGAMKIFTALEICKREINTNYEMIIDLCLKNDFSSSRHACDDFNLLYVLYKSSLRTNYRLKEIQNFSINFLKKISKYYWANLGGFSFYPNSSQHSFMGSRITAGYPEPDLHGTLMMLWAISIASKIVNWDEVNIQYSFV